MGPDKLFIDCNRKARKPCEINLGCGRNSVRWRMRNIDILTEMRLDEVR
jgi:hypothetical protein